MANFEIAYKRTCKFEGGYVNDDADSGKETYKGISRTANPKWSGWKIIDSCKKQKGFPKNLDNDQTLQSLVCQCYKENYWNPIWGDKLSNQEVANDLYDTAVNMGVGMSIKLAQRQFKLKESGKMDTVLLGLLNRVTK